MNQLQRPFTVDDFAELPADELRFEVLSGELFEAPTPPVIHQRALGQLLIRIHEHLEHYRLGEAFGMRFDVHLSPYDILKPDISVVLSRNAERIKDFGVVGAPDLVIEILSPSSAHIDRVRKVAVYATFEVPEYWIVDPETETILAQTLSGGRYRPMPSDDGRIHSLQIEGLEIDPADVFHVPEWLKIGSE
jgi:Uma2 family endonuclease